MQFFITGGTGLIGQKLVERLNKENKVTVLSRSPDKARQKLPASVAIIGHLDELDNFNDIDVVINLAGEPIADKRWSEEQKYRICQSRWQLTNALVSKINASENPPQVFISGSAIGYYGRQGNERITEENSEPHQEFTHKVCHRWEQIAGSAHHSCRVCLLRTGVVLSPQGGALAKMRFPFKLGLGGPIGSGEQYMSWIHIDDVVNGILFLISQEQCRGAFNFTAPEPETNKVFVKTLGNVLHRPAILPIPAFALKLLMGEAADMLITGQRVIPQRLQDAGFVFQYPTLESAFQATEG